MSKPKRARYSGVGVYANEWLLSRVQSISTDIDLSEEEVRELTNPEVVEFAAQTPSVSVTIDANEYGSMRNLRCIAGVTGATDNITVASFDGTSTDIGVMVEEDDVLARTAYINDAFLSSISWNFDVGGVATEGFTFETDNYTWYRGDSRQIYVLNAIPTGDWGSDQANSGWFYVNAAPVNATASVFATGYEIVKIYVDGIAQPTGNMDIIASGSGTRYTHLIRWESGVDTACSGTRYRVAVKHLVPDTTIPQAPSTSPIGGITRGMIDICLATGDVTMPAEGTTDFLRLQSVSIDADLSREVLEELGHYRAFDRSLTYPVPVNVTFSALSSDLEEWFKFQSDDDMAADESTGIGSFTKTAKLQIRIYDAKDTEDTRNLKKEIVISGLQITSTSFGVDVGSNATQDFTSKSSNFRVTGWGVPSGAAM